ncbi:NAD/NADP transhydrogenase alpha subunit [Xylanibacillus composti]|nr:NAD/NADP transhydrogenase alpha subunit [Xylanibacillus composti]MDT9725527.1 NAD/NADP transhydrogenase alpha subunit [Xylanibacillus composti]
MKCISVYTDNFEQFSDIYEAVLAANLGENEERDFEGITASESGEVPEHYLERMRSRPDVVVMKLKDKDITILQHGEVFEILIPSASEVLS